MPVSPGRVEPPRGDCVSCVSAGEMSFGAPQLTAAMELL